VDAVGALEVGHEALFVLIKISLPIMSVALVVGLIISLFQALTQIQEMTLSFVPKILAIFVALLIFLPFIGNELMALSEHMAERIIAGGGNSYR
tara:strand:+ start:112 stop:393 length:282 start_codon:yes stop_codon:yes gene_type:complete